MFNQVLGAISCPRISAPFDPLLLPAVGDALKFDLCDVKVDPLPWKQQELWGGWVPVLSSILEIWLRGMMPEKEECSCLGRSLCIAHETDLLTDASLSVQHLEKVFRGVRSSQLVPVRDLLLVRGGALG